MQHKIYDAFKRRQARIFVYIWKKRVVFWTLYTRKCIHKYKRVHFWEKTGEIWLFWHAFLGLCMIMHVYICTTHNRHSFVQPITDTYFYTPSIHSFLHPITDIPFYTPMSCHFIHWRLFTCSCLLIRKHYSMVLCGCLAELRLRLGYGSVSHAL